MSDLTGCPLCDAKARLNAAAPDLLEALKGAADHLRTRLSPIYGEGKFPKARAALAAAEAAIAKATGEAQ